MQCGRPLVSRPSVFVNGLAVTGHPCVTQRAYQFGDGLFETVAVTGGAPCLWGHHRDRLFEGCRRLRLPQPDGGRLDAEIHAACDEIDSGTLKLFLTAGSSPRGYRRPGKIEVERVIVATPSKMPLPERAWTVRLCTHRLSENPILAGIKHLNRLDQVLARAEWDGEFDEGVMLNQSGAVVCGTRTNLIVQGPGGLRTPDVGGAGVAGVVRRLAIELGDTMRSPVEVEDLSVEALGQAEALYMTNSLVGVARVGSIAGRQLDLAIEEHPVIRELRRRCHAPDHHEVQGA